MVRLLIYNREIGGSTPPGCTNRKDDMSKECVDAISDLISMEPNWPTHGVMTVGNYLPLGKIMLGGVFTVRELEAVVRVIRAFNVKETNASV
ncbi:hypothetical protein UFOVP276_195 [uncultured Caudovirales phage]|uniref:Uncharacterized protein n=1 Tax=uncultured Caudovirales phage TaxID=2100421 RepID=A0A6J5LIH1_9CAUD|nr:hypothetical protein UFOVP127_89 [uncultured Caudovirales phage]CAB4135239.1 hypothetical protein UFOVP276_195 [uncultured Caudovirales phage]